MGFESFPQGEGSEDEEARMALERKREAWNAKLTEMDTVGDRLGHPLDAGIKEGVAAFQVNEFPTAQSCEGHLEHGEPFPWMNVQAPPPEGWEDDEAKQQQWRENNGENERRLREYLTEFYAERDVLPDLRLILQPKGIYGAFRVLSSGAIEPRPSLDAEGSAKRLEALRTEMRAFTDFLREKFLRV